MNLTMAADPFFPDRGCDPPGDEARPLDRGLGFTGLRALAPGGMLCGLGLTAPNSGCEGWPEELFLRSARWGHVDHSFIFQVAVPLWTFPRFRGSLFCELPPPLLPLTLRLQVPLTLSLGHLVSLGKVESRCWRLGLGILVLLGKVEDTLTWEGRLGSQPWFRSPE